MQNAGIFTLYSETWLSSLHFTRPGTSRARWSATDSATVKYYAYDRMTETLQLQQSTRVCIQCRAHDCCPPPGLCLTLCCFFIFFLFFFLFAVVPLALGVILAIDLFAFFCIAAAGWCRAFICCSCKRATFSCGFARAASLPCPCFEAKAARSRVRCARGGSKSNLTLDIAKSGLARTLKLQADRST